MATVPELKAQADSLGVKYGSKVRKAELEVMVTGAIEARERAAASRIAPMPNDARHANYVDQNMRDKRSQCLTPRQARRIRKADNRAKARA